MLGSQIFQGPECIPDLFLCATSVCNGLTAHPGMVQNRQAAVEVLKTLPAMTLRRRDMAESAVQAWPARTKKRTRRPLIEKNQAVRRSSGLFAAWPDTAAALCSGRGLPTVLPRLLQPLPNPALRQTGHVRMLGLVPQPLALRASTACSGPSACRRLQKQRRRHLRHRARA